MELVSVLLLARSAMQNDILTGFWTVSSTMMNSLVISNSYA